MAAASGNGPVKTKLKPHWGATFLAGAASGATEITFTMPFDTVKTFCQVNRGNSGPLAAAREIHGLKGFQGFYFGMPALLTQVAGKQALRFSAFEQVKTFLLSSAFVPKGSVDGLAGICAGFIEAFLWTTPTERLKVLRQNDIKSGLNRYASLPGAIRTVSAEHGIRGLYAGIGATGIRQASGVGVRFAVYGRIKAAISSDPPKLHESALAGGVTGCVGTVLNHPIDVVKSRIEAQDGKVKEYTNVFQAFRKMVLEEGWRVMYTGLAPRLIKISLGQAITFAAYESYLSTLSPAFSS